MPAAARKLDKCSGHSCFPPRDAEKYSDNVYINGQNAVRKTDMFKDHECPLMGSHTGTVVSGSGTVFINGKAAARIGEEISCGSIIAMGSDDVFIGG